MGLKRSRILEKIIRYTFNIILAVIFLAPLVWMVVSSVKPEINIFADMTSVKAFLPIDGSFDNYRTILEKGEIVRTMWNSIYYVSITIFVGLIVNLKSPDYGLNKNFHQFQYYIRSHTKKKVLL